jgi:uncharacterized protein (TIGR04255 family)
MADPAAVQINRSERFELLPRAPVAEAVIDLRARVEAPWEEGRVTRELKQLLPDYPTLRRMAGVSFTAHFPAGEDIEHPAPIPMTQDHGWLGLRTESHDGRLIATFTRDGFSLSRLSPYTDWEHFRLEAMRLWAIYVALAAPPGVQRLAVRFINRIEVPLAGLEFSEYFNGLGEPPGGLPTAGFLYRDSLGVPGHPYLLSVIRTFQPPDGPNAATLSLLLDIDAVCPEPSKPETGIIDGRLADLHWLKNRVFFTVMTKKALDLCR